MSDLPFCSTCGVDIHEVLCAKCGKWWQDNDPTIHTQAKEITRLRAENERLRAFEQLMPLPYDVLTNAEMRAAKGNWRSLIDQMNNARQALQEQPND